jgi:ribosomal protein L11 methyltransferase
MSEPLNIAPRVTMYPSGCALPAALPGWISLAQRRAAVSPAAFGDGSHPTTRLCAAAVDFHCRGRQSPAVLDIGTGTGVLARIARARGARLIVATDADPAALSCARAHAALDAHPVGIQFSDLAPDHWGRQFDLVVANILQAPLQRLAPAMCRALVPGGVLLISGFTRAEAPSLHVRYEGAGLTLQGRAYCDEWVLLSFTQS